MDAAQISKLLAITAYKPYSLALDGALSGKSKGTEYYEFVSHPRVGQIVVETSSLHRRGGPENIGRLVSITREPMYTPKEWKDEAGPIPQDTFWTIELLHDGSLFKWSNCSFIVVPEKYIF